MRDIDEGLAGDAVAVTATAHSAFEPGLGPASDLDLLEKLHLTIDALEEIVRRETGFVRAGDVGAVAALQETKSHTAALYQSQANAVLSCRGSLLGGEANPFRSQLTERTQALRQVMADNRIALNAAKTARYHRIEAVMLALRDQIEKQSTYTPNGGLASNRARRRPLINRSYNAKI